MDRSSSHAIEGILQNQELARTRPRRNVKQSGWRNQRAQNTEGDYSGSLSRAGVDIYALVDSWRSYKDDLTNLQSISDSTSRLNATAPSFQPAQVGSYYKPYEALRTSTGARERGVVECARNTSGEGNILEVASGFAKRHPVRSDRTQADQPLPSIEGVNTEDNFNDNSLSQVLKGLRAGQHRRCPSQRRTPRQTASPAPPSSTGMYRSQALQEPTTLVQARKLLVILDLNGTLLYRVKASSKKKVHMRPGVTPLLEYLFNNHVVMVYTSTMPDTATDMVSQFIHPSQRRKLAAVWARDKLDLNEEQYNSKVQVYKKLDKVWNDETIQATADSGKKWDQSNTVLIDDSKLKALAQPHNLLQVVEYMKEDDPNKEKDQASKNQKLRIQVDILKQLELKLEALKYQQDVSTLIRKWQVGELPVPRLPGQQISVEESVDQRIMHTHAEGSESEQEGAGRSQLPTPVSIKDGETAERPLEISDDEADHGATACSGAPSSARSQQSVNVVDIPGLGTPQDGDEVKMPMDRQSRESSISEAVFNELLGNIKH